MSSSEMQGKMNDSLPYIDATHEDYEEYAMHLIEEEMKKIRPRTFEAVPEVRFRSPFMEDEYKRVIAKEPAPKIQSIIPQLPTENTVEAWEEAVKQAKIAYETERIRSILLDICKDGSLSSEQWKQMNQHLEQMKSDIEKSAHEQKTRVDTINLQRQASQEKVGQELKVLMIQYETLLEKNHQLKQAIAELKDEIGQNLGDE